MESEEKLANKALVFNHLRIDRLNHDSKHGWMLETEVFIFNLSLRERKELLVVIDAFARIRCLLHLHCLHVL